MNFERIPDTRDRCLIPSLISKFNNTVPHKSRRPELLKKDMDRGGIGREECIVASDGRCRAAEHVASGVWSCYRRTKVMDVRWMC